MDFTGVELTSVQHKAVQHAEVVSQIAYATEYKMIKKEEKEDLSTSFHTLIFRDEITIPYILVALFSKTPVFFTR